MNQSIRAVAVLASMVAAPLIARSAQAADQPSTQPASHSTGSYTNVADLNGAMSSDYAKKIYDEVTPSLVAVQFTWEYEYGKADFVQSGVVVSEDGLILVPGGELIPRLPNSQLRDFKIIIPQVDKDNDELEAELVGRDLRTDVVFVRAKEKRAWKPVHFEDVPVTVGEPLISVGLLSREAGYRSYIETGIVGAYSRGEMPTYVTTGGGLANIGAPVFNASGKAIGWVNYYMGTQFLLHTTFGRRGEQIEPLAPIVNPPHLFVPTRAFAQSLKDPPVAGQRQKLPWLGMPNLSGVDKDVAQVLGLENQPAIEIGDIVPGSPAEKAGFKVGMKIIKVNGKPLERGDLPEELPGIMQRRLIGLPIGSKVTFTVMTEKDQPTKEITATLEERPMDQTYAKRIWEDDLGFGARNVVFEDTYARKQPADLKGVLVTIIKPNSAAASGKLAREDIVTQFNSQPVTDVDQFETDYKAFRKEKTKEAIVLVVMKHDGSTQTIRIEPPQ